MKGLKRSDNIGHAVVKGVLWARSRSRWLRKEKSKVNMAKMERVNTMYDYVVL